MKRRRKGRTRTTTTTTITTTSRRYQVLLAAVSFAYCCAQAISPAYAATTATTTSSKVLRNPSSDLESALLLPEEEEGDVDDDESVEERLFRDGSLENNDDGGAATGVDDDNDAGRWDYLWDAFEVDDDEYEDGPEQKADTTMIFDSSEILAPSADTPSEAILAPSTTLDEVVIGEVGVTELEPATDGTVDEGGNIVEPGLVDEIAAGGAARLQKVEEPHGASTTTCTTTTTTTTTNEVDPKENVVPQVAGRETTSKKAAENGETKKESFWATAEKRVSETTKEAFKPDKIRPVSSDEVSASEESSLSDGEETEQQGAAGVVVLNEEQLSQTLRQQTKPHSTNLSKEVQDRLAAQSILPKAKSKSRTITTPLTAPILLSILPKLKNVARKVADSSMVVNVMVVIVFVNALWVPVRRAFGIRPARGGWNATHPGVVLPEDVDDEEEEDDDEAAAALERRRYQQREQQREREMEAAAASRRRAIQLQELEEERIMEAQRRRQRRRSRFVEDDLVDAMTTTTVTNPVDTNTNDDVDSVPKTMSSWQQDSSPSWRKPFRRRRFRKSESERLPSQRQLADRNQELQTALNTLTSQKDQLEKDYERTSWQLQEAQSEVASLTASSKYLQSQLYESQQLVEQTARIERRRTQSQLRQVKQNMLGVLEQERETMKKEWEQQTSDLQTWIQDQQQQQQQQQAEKQKSSSSNTSSSSRRGARSTTTTKTKSSSSSSSSTRKE